MKFMRESSIGIYPIVDFQFCQKQDFNLFQFVNQILKKEVRILQYRDKVSDDRVFTKNATEILRLCEKKAVLFIVNDRIEIAREIGASGVHLGQEEIGEGLRACLPLRRYLGRGRKLVGISSHSLEQALEVADLKPDYISIGPVFKTKSKPEAKPIGLEVVSEVVKRVNIPVVAIGGINQNNMKKVFKTGVNGVAMISGIESV